MIDEAKVMAYTLLAYSYEVGFYDAHQCSLIIPTTAVIIIAKSYRICLTNHMRLIDFTYITQYNTTVVYSHWQYGCIWYKKAFWSDKYVQIVLVIGNVQ